MVAAARGRQGRCRKLVHCLVCKSYSQLEHQQAWLRRLAGSQAGQSEQADNENSHVGAAGGQDQLDGSLLLSTAPIKARCGLPRCCSGKRLLGEQGPGPDPAVQDERACSLFTACQAMFGVLHGVRKSCPAAAVAAAAAGDGLRVHAGLRSSV